MSVERILSRTGLGAILTLAMIPALFEIGPRFEQRFAPVINDVVISDVTRTDMGVSFYVEFAKLRQCEFLGISWYQGNVRVGVAFEPGAENYPKTRPAGDQFAGPWMLVGAEGIEGTRAVVHHRCHPLWITTSHFYP